MDNTADNSAITERIFSLRYAAYVDQNSIPENNFQLFRDTYDDAENCRSHIEYIEGMPAGSIRACIYNPLTPHLMVPAQKLFADEVERHIGHDAVFVESNRFVIHPHFQKRAMRIKLKLFKFIFDQAVSVNAKYMVTSPRATQTEFYRSMHFHPISGVKRSLALNFDVVLMACSMDEARHYLKTDPKYKMLTRFGIR